MGVRWWAKSRDPELDVSDHIASTDIILSGDLAFIGFQMSRMLHSKFQVPFIVSKMQLK